MPLAGTASSSLSLFGEGASKPKAQLVEGPCHPQTRTPAMAEMSKRFHQEGAELYVSGPN